MIIVTGASGQLGRRIVEKLLARVSPEQVGVTLRDVRNARELGKLGVRVRQADYADPSSLAPAWQGASQLLLVSSNADAYGGDALAQHRSAIAAAKSAGVRRVIYTSQMAADPASVFQPARVHAATEAMLASSGLRWTSLRNGFYAASALAILKPALANGTLDILADGKIAWTSHDDLAEAAAAVLADEGRFEGPTPVLTAGETLGFSDLCTIASELLGRPIRSQLISEETFRASLQKFEVPATRVEIFISLYRASQRGEFDKTDPTLAQLIGRAPKTMRAILAEELGGGA
ncbi:MAG: hypothetical protein RL033_1594 [Pseudomonadota bacterium]